MVYHFSFAFSHFIFTLNAIPERQWIHLKMETKLSANCTDSFRVKNSLWQTTKWIVWQTKCRHFSENPTVHNDRNFCIRTNVSLIEYSVLTFTIDHVRRKCAVCLRDFVLVCEPFKMVSVLPCILITNLDQWPLCASLKQNGNHIYEIS